MRMGENNPSGNVTVTAAVFCVLALLCNGLDAYALFGIPLPWYGSTFPFLALLAVAGRQDIEFIPATSWLWALIAWLAVITLAHTVWGDYFLRMPGTATARYPVFVLLRFFNLLSFLAVLYVVYGLCREGRCQQVVDCAVYVGVLLAGYALYVYSATVFGWPEVPRNRPGTGPTGEQAVTVFTYAFHRALGSFREPGLMAQWMALPFFLCFIHSSRCRYVYALIIGTALLLSGSLTGIMSVFFGFFLAAVIFTLRRTIDAAHLFRFAVVLIVSGAVFGFFVVGYGESGYEKESALVLLTTLADRIMPILEGGMSMSNRGYVYEYVFSHVPPVLGYGVGHANILFSGTSDQLVSFLSLYFNILYSGGLVGLLLLLCFLLRPLGYAWSRAHDGGPDSFFILSGYLAWFFIFFANAEELSMLFGIVYGLLLFRAEGIGPALLSPAAETDVTSAKA